MNTEQRIEPVSEKLHRELWMMIRYPGEQHVVNHHVARALLADLLTKLGRITPVPPARRGYCPAALATERGWQECYYVEGHEGAHENYQAEWDDTDINHHIAVREG